MILLRSEAIHKAASLPVGDPTRRKLLAMISGAKVGYGEDSLTLSYQADFPKTVPCVKCGGGTRHAVTLMEGGTRPRLHPNDPKGEGFWFHDYAAFSLYLCRDIDCGTVTTEWNQA